VKMALAELISGIVFLIIAIVFFTMTLKLPPPMNQSDLGPATFPYIIIFLMAILACVLIYRGVKERENTKQPVIKIKRQNSVLLVILGVFIYINLMPIIGYYISTLISLPVILWFAGEKKPIKIALLSGGFLLFAKVVFDMLLGVPLP